jgi:hypothetical protein
MRALPVIASLERYERRIQSEQWRAIKEYIIAVEEELLN